MLKFTTESWTLKNIVKHLSNNPTHLYLYVTALRGPDFGCYTHKQIFTSFLRGFRLPTVNTINFIFTLTNEDTKNLKETLLNEARNSPSFSHYISHVFDALKVISKLPLSKNLRKIVKLLLKLADTLTDVFVEKDIKKIEEKVEKTILDLRKVVEKASKG